MLLRFVVCDARKETPSVAHTRTTFLARKAVLSSKFTHFALRNRKLLSNIKCVGLFPASTFVGQG